MNAMLDYRLGGTAPTELLRMGVTEYLPRVQSGATGLVRWRTIEVHALEKATAAEVSPVVPPEVERLRGQPVL
jgi:hypothetical protein